MLVTFDHQTIHCPPGDTYQSLAEARYPDRRILAVRVGGETLPLTTAPHEGDCAQGITLTDAEGGLIYERSLRFVFLLAMRQLYPDCRVRLEHSVGRGVYGTVSGLLLTEGRLEEIKARMRDIIARDLPFERVEMSREQAIAYFEQCGESDKVRLLRYRPSERFTLYRAGDMMEYFYGVMTPSTGYTPVFDRTGAAAPAGGRARPACPAGSAAQADEDLCPVGPMGSHSGLQKRRRPQRDGGEALPARVHPRQ